MFGLFGKKKKNDSEAETIRVPAAERRIYIIDFDRTITIMHTGGIAYGKELSPDFVAKNTKNGFDDFIRQVTRRGHSVYIASYNDDTNADTVADKALSGHELIKFYMDVAFGLDQNLFTVSRREEVGTVPAAGNIIAGNSQDRKQHHLDTIARQEGLDQTNPDDMKRIFLLEDDEDIVRHYMEKGCTVLVPFSASRSADTAATKTLFTAYMPKSFIE